MKIPKDQKADRVDFKIIDKNGGEKKISLRIGEIDNRIPETQNIKLTIKGIPDVIHRGDFLEIFGTGDPGSAITAEIANSDGKIINSRTAEIDNKGNWKLDKPIIIKLDTPFGKYSATITDGRQNILKHWIVESDKVIIITPSSLKFDVNEVMKFNGTALPNNPIEVVLEDPLGKEVFADIIQTDDSGYLEFEFTTTQNTIKGTYTLIATQGIEKEFIYAGYQTIPSIPVNLGFDKLNYKTGDTAIISLIGLGSDIVSLLIIDPSDKPKGDTISITLQPDGRGSYSLNLDGYGSGIYTAVISKGSTQNSEIFAIGLQTGSGDIEINTTKTDYLPGDSILILGDTSANSLLTITLIDPDGNEIKTKSTFSDKSGKISESSFRIPSAAQAGMWEINVKSGANFDIAEIKVLATLIEGMQISVEETYDPSISHLGTSIAINAVGVTQTVEIEIIAEDGEIIDTLSPRATSQGNVGIIWFVPDDIEPGMYTFRITDTKDFAETIFELKQ